jgi:iron uptake system EfeUOB component EfeO/EfeM
MFLGKKTGLSWQSNPQLRAAVSGYSIYLQQNVAQRITHTQTLCTAINSEGLQTAELAYSTTSTSSG